MQISSTLAQITTINSTLDNNETLLQDLEDSLVSINGQISDLEVDITNLEAGLMAAEGTLAFLESLHVDPQCNEPYTTITDGRRNVTTHGSPYVCDSGISPGWYRFSGTAGTHIPLSAPPKLSCGTHAPGWMNGSLPADSDGIVTRQVCYPWFSSTCQWSNNIQVVSCGDFYLYKLVRTPTCNLRYCGTN